MSKVQSAQWCVCVSLRVRVPAASVYIICALVCDGYKLDWVGAQPSLSLSCLQLQKPPNFFLKPQKELFRPEQRNSSNFFQKGENKSMFS